MVALSNVSLVYVYYANQSINQSTNQFHQQTRTASQLINLPTNQKFISLCLSITQLIIFFVEEGINFQAFMDYMGSYEGFRDHEAEYTAAFRTLDIDGNGTLSTDELQ